MQFPIWGEFGVRLNCQYPDQDDSQVHLSQDQDRQFGDVKIFNHKFVQIHVQ